MKINLYATFRQVAGAKSIDLDLPDQATVQDMLGAIPNIYPQLGPLLVDESGHLPAHVHVFINGHDIQYLPNGMRTCLASADKIDIFPPVAGGSS
jgi:molybdopterin synthase sulfur carrier subunit